MRFTFTLTSSLKKTLLIRKRLVGGMMGWKMMLENALCWTLAAPFIRAKRQRAMHEVAADWYDRRRIDRLLNELVTTYSDLLG